MPPKKAGGASGGAAAAAGDSKEKKGGTSVKVRHILCEKQSKVLEALEKIKAGQKFDEIARQYSEDKARSGVYIGFCS
jgi:NIMA-interacting peptidyl-prolyl cis-trans isomerase 4